MSGEYGIKLWNRSFRGCCGENFDFRVSTVFINHDNQYSPVGNGPTKSTATLVQAFSGGGEGFSGSGGEDVP